MNVRQMFLNGAAALLLMMGASTASAVLMTVEVETGPPGASEGSWNLRTLPGLSFVSGASWDHNPGIFGPSISQSWDVIIGAGDYRFDIGGWVQTSVVSWSIALDGDVFYADDQGSFLIKRDINGRTTFDVAAAVPEPAPLALLGGGILALAFYRRRRSA